MRKTTLIDISEQRFGKLVAKRVTQRGNRQTRVKWLCECDCGNTAEVSRSHLRAGSTLSCGCLRSENSGKATRFKRVHGMSRSPEWNSWDAMVSRCHDPSDKSYPKYGGSGIVVCDLWRHSFQSFYNDMGPRPSSDHTLHRIDDHQTYETGTVMWAPSWYQSLYRKSTRWTNLYGQRMCESDLAKMIGVVPSTVGARRRRGESAKDIASDFGWFLYA